MAVQGFDRVADAERAPAARGDDDRAAVVGEFDPDVLVSFDNRALGLVASIPIPARAVGLMMNQTPKPKKMRAAMMIKSCSGDFMTQRLPAHTAGVRSPDAHFLRITQTTPSGSSSRALALLSSSISSMTGSISA